MMQVSKETKFKECAPEQTVENIKSMLKEIGIEPEEKWMETGIDDLYTLRLTYNGSESMLPTERVLQRNMPGRALTPSSWKDWKTTT